MKENMKENMEEAIDEVDYSDVGSEALYEYITSLIVQVTHELSDDVENIEWSMDDDTVTIKVTFNNGSEHSFDFEQWRFMMNKYYISTDIDMIVDEVTDYMKLHGLTDYEESEWEYYGKKSVMDSDGFWTDYTMWHNLADDTWACFFGDSDIYTPENSDPDAEFDTQEECQEWFDDYKGFEEDEWYEDDIEESQNINSNSLADLFERVHDKDEINWQMHDYNYEPFYEELREYMRENETWDDKDNEGYPVDTNVSLTELFSRMPESKQVDFMNRFYIHKDTKSPVESGVDYNFSATGLDVDSDSKDMNATEVVIWMYEKFPDWAFVDEKDEGDKVHLIFESGRKDRDVLETELKKRNLKYKISNKLHVWAPEASEYEEVEEQKDEITSAKDPEFFDKGDNQTYWYMTHHGVMPGSVPRGLNILEVIDTKEGTYFKTDRVITTKALNYYDIKEQRPKGVQASETNEEYYTHLVDENDHDAVDALVDLDTPDVDYDTLNKAVRAFRVDLKKIPSDMSGLDSKYDRDKGRIYTKYRPLVDCCRQLDKELHPTGYGKMDYVDVKKKELCRFVDYNFPFGWKSNAQYLRGCNIVSYFDPIADMDAKETIGKLNKGDKFRNRKGVVITITDPAADGRIQYCIGDECRIGSEKSIQKMLYDNNYLRCSVVKGAEDSKIKVVDKNWDTFLKKIESALGLKVDSAYKRRRKGDNFIQLIDEDSGDLYEAEITEYSDGTYELLEANVHRQDDPKINIKSNVDHEKKSYDETKVVDKNWTKFIQKLETALDMKVHGASSEDIEEGENFIHLFDEDTGDWHEAKITKSPDGSYEFFERDLYLLHSGEDVESCSGINASTVTSAVRSMSSVKDKIVSAIRELKSMRDDVSVDRQSDRIESAIDHLNRAYGLLYM